MFATTIRAAALSLLLLTLAACATDPARNGGLPTSQRAHDPDDGMIDVAVQDYLKATHGPLFSSYNYTRSDLDGDGRREALVMFTGPHNYWCDMDGCSLMVLKAANNGFAPMSQMFPVRGPLYISDQTSDGWKNLVVRVSGLMTVDTKTVAMRFNGLTYPQNPILQPGIQISQADMKQRIFP